MKPSLAFIITVNKRQKTKNNERREFSLRNSRHLNIMIDVVPDLIFITGFFMFFICSSKEVLY